MDTGGVQKSLAELIRGIHEGYDITVCCIRKKGILLKSLPEDVRVIEAGRFAKSTEYAAGESKSLGLPCCIMRVCTSAWAKLFGKAFPYFIITRLQKKLRGYDAAISFAQPLHDKAVGNISNEFVLNCCEAKKKITFVHCDFENYGGNTPYNRSLYKKFDKIACVSDSVRLVFEKCNPDCRGKTVTVENLHDYEYIRAAANNDEVKYDGKHTVVTVARLSEEKGLLRCVDIFGRLKKSIPDIEWHIVGEGAQRAALEKEITERGLEKTVFLHGNRENPYRYIKNANLFLLPSYHEASPMVFWESACLGVPVLSTNTLSAVEIVEKRGLGAVCGNTSEEIERGIIKMLSEKTGVRKTVFGNDEAINRFAELLD